MQPIRDARNHHRLLHASSWVSALDRPGQPCQKVPSEDGAGGVSAERRTELGIQASIVIQSACDHSSATGVWRAGQASAWGMPSFMSLGLDHDGG